MPEMTDLALKNDTLLQVPRINVSEIYLDHEFNCRGYFSATECVQLAQDIASRGLQQPVVVRKLREESIPRLGLKHELDLIKKGFKYKMIAGHRRLMSYKINDADKIPCFIKPATINEFEEHDLNAIENLQRQELNFAQEANAIRHYWIAGWSRDDIATKIGKSPGWVQARVILLEMPEEVRALAARGYIKPTDMNELNKFKRREMTQLLEVVAKIRDKRKKGEKNILHNVKKQDKPTTKKHRQKIEVFEMMETLQDTLKNLKNDGSVAIKDLVTPHGNTLATRVLGWASGEVSTGEIHDDIAKFCALVGIVYKKPEFEELV